jgi:UDP-N-acetyl-D-glucosamine dehydrogenase
MATIERPARTATTARPARPAKTAKTAKVAKAAKSKTRQDPGAALRRRLAAGSASVGVIGLGYIGLPLAMAFAESGSSVLGFDVDAQKVAMLTAGGSHSSPAVAARLRPLLAAGRFAATDDFARLGEPDALVICVPTPLTPHREPDMTHIIRTARQLAARLRRGQLVVLESTTYPGTTDELLRGMLEQSGLRCGEDFFLAFSPERHDPGAPRRSLTSIPKVVGGVDAAAADLTEALYRRIVPRTVRVSSARTAEATKLAENIFRAVNIALVNELKVIYDKLGVDIWEVLDAAATKPFGFMRFDPGPGWGGHCIPLDPFYLTWKAREVGQATGFIELAGQVNARMHDWVIEKLTLALNERGKPVKGSRVLVLGIAYKKDLGDARESPALDIVGRLWRLGAEVAYHDPWIPCWPRPRDAPELTSVALEPDALRRSDAVLILTDHSGCDYEMVLAHAPLIVDTRGVFRSPCDKVVKA